MWGRGELTWQSPAAAAGSEGRNRRASLGVPRPGKKRGGCSGGAVPGGPEPAANGRSRTPRLSQSEPAALALSNERPGRAGPLRGRCREARGPGAARGCGRAEPRVRGGGGGVGARGPRADGSRHSPTAEAAAYKGRAAVCAAGARNGL